MPPLRPRCLPAADEYAAARGGDHDHTPGLQANQATKLRRPTTTTTLPRVESHGIVN
ncbi:MAG TPA: hypothetical protein VKE49_11450 [Myxococcaceae bacterium]|nr:hypothetical protein [Myxococcaceae bacterium]